MKCAKKNIQMQKLSRLAILKSDMALSKLAQAQAACRQTENMLQALEDQAIKPAPGLLPLLHAETSALYRSWAAPRQVALNIKLARQRARTEEIKLTARYELGRSDLLGRLTFRNSR